MPRTILQLPPEIQSAIISWVLRPGDIARVCLVCRQLWDVAMAALYRSMYLNVDRWSHSHLEDFLRRGHRGHQFVRSLDIDSENIETEEIALKHAKDAVQILPRGCLSSFRCPLEDGIDNDLMILLASTQNNLDFLSLGPLRDNALNLPGSLQPWPRTIKTLVVPWRIFCPTDVDYYPALIKRSEGKLKALTIRSECIDRGSSGKPFLVPKNVYGSGEFFVRGLFSYFLNEKSHSKLEICDLNLQNQDLLNAKDTWLRAIDFTKLRTLQLWNCSGTDYLLQELRDLAKREGMQLYGLVLSIEKVTEAPTLALSFIQSLPLGLKYLNLCYCPDTTSGTTDPAMEEPLAQIILPQSTRLSPMKDLYIGIGANSASAQLRVPSIQDLSQIGTTCMELRQLAIALPQISFDDAFAGRWGDYATYLELLAAMSKVKTVRILTWPIIDERYFHGQHGRLTKAKTRARIYLRFLDIFATSVARYISLARAGRGQRLSVLMFGSAEMGDVITDSSGTADDCMKGPMSYKVRRMETEFGAVTKAKRIESHLMEFEEPVAFVVDEDTDQGLSLEAYSWGC